MGYGKAEKLTRNMIKKGELLGKSDIPTKEEIKEIKKKLDELSQKIGN
jgi:hypothetical protein